jgi:hypothetical protein
MYATVTVNGRQVIYDHPSVCIRFAQLLDQAVPNTPVILTIFWALNTTTYTVQNQQIIRNR